MKNLDVIMREEARLIILKCLMGEVTETLSSNMLVDVLATYGIRRDRNWVHTELRWLAVAGAITIIEHGSIIVPKLTELGASHVKREAIIDGIKRPSRLGG